MAWRICRFFASAAALAALLACSAAPGDTTLFPLDEGRSWRYQIVTTYGDPSVAPDRDSVVLSSRGSARLGAEAAWRRSSNNGNDYWLRSDDTGIYRVASKGPLDTEPQADASPRYVLRKPYAVGTTWSAATTPYVLQRRNESPRELRHLLRYKSLPMTYRIDAVDQEVKTPAGDFKGCLRVQGKADIRLYVDEAFTWRDVPMTTREWYCPGVGLTRIEREEPSPSKFILGGTQVLELMQWH